jgi:hypothetical protein
MSALRSSSQSRRVVLISSGLLGLTILGMLFAPAALAATNKNIEIRASIQADAAQPANHRCNTINGVVGMPFQNTATLGTAPGDTWHSVGQVIDTTCVYFAGDRVSYTGTEAGTVTIDGCGTGFVVLEFSGSLAGATERSVARLQPGMGTGDLKGASGTVISESALNPDFSAVGVLTGTVHCPRTKR